MLFRKRKIREKKSAKHKNKLLKNNRIESASRTNVFAIQKNTDAKGTIATYGKLKCRLSQMALFLNTAKGKNWKNKGNLLVFLALIQHQKDEFTNNSNLMKTVLFTPPTCESQRGESSQFFKTK